MCTRVQKGLVHRLFASDAGVSTKMGGVNKFDRILKGWLAFLSQSRFEPIMLKNLPIIPSQTSQNYYFISITPPIIPFLLYCVNDNITMQECLCIIYIATDCFNRIFDCSIWVSQSFANYIGGHRKHLGGPRPCQACLCLCHCLKLMYPAFHMFQPF